MGAEIIPYRIWFFYHYKGSCQWNDNSMTIAAHIALKLSFIDMYNVNKRIIIKL